MTTQIIRVGRAGVARLNVDVKGLVGQAIKDKMIATAREVHAEEMRRGFDPEPRRIIDGRFDAAITSVKPFGRIVLADRVSIASAVLWTYELMRRQARRFKKTGAYEASITILIERTPVDATEGAINTAFRRQPDAAVIIVPLIIYARRLELRYRAVDATYRLARTRFGGSMFVTKHSVYAGEVGSADTVTRNYTHNKRLAEPKTVEAVYPGIRMYRRIDIGTKRETVN